MTATLPAAPQFFTDADLERLPPQLRDRELLAWLWAQDAGHRRARRKGSYSMQFNHDEEGVCANVNIVEKVPGFTVHFRGSPKRA